MEHTQTHTHRHSTLENTPRITQTRAVQSHRKTDLQQTTKQKKKKQREHILQFKKQEHMRKETHRFVFVSK